jgi:hypothetical protein
LTAKNAVLAYDCHLFCNLMIITAGILIKKVQDFKQLTTGQTSSLMKETTIDGS